MGHSECPKCGSRDNRANYSDGGWFCFGCRDSGRGTNSGFVSERNIADATADEPTIAVPSDAGTNFSPTAVAHLAKYGITVPDAIRFGLKFSAYYNQLIYEYRDKEGITKCIQARNFDPDRAAKAKYFNRGSTSEVSPIYKAQESLYTRRLVITEDALSAMRIASVCDAMPALGTNVPVHKIVSLIGSYEFVTVWLDSDKWREAREIAEKCLWTGLSANTVFSELDPKCYTTQEIMEYLK